MKMKYCPKCGFEKSIFEFHIRTFKSGKQGYYTYCKDHHGRSRIKDPIKAKQKRDEKKRRVMLYYSHGKLCCKCCGEKKMEFLTMHHVNNDGAKHRKEIGRSPQNLYKWIIDNNFPEGFQVLCFNCNCAKEYSGYCPHEKEREKIILITGLLSNLG